MDHIAIQIQLLKDYGKTKDRFIVKRIDGNVYISPAGFYYVVIPENEYLLNMPENPNFTGFNDILKGGEKAGLPAIVTDYAFKKGANTYVKLHTVEFDLWVNYQRLKAFGKVETLKIIAYSALKPIYIYQNDVLLGGIPPFVTKQ